MTKKSDIVTFVYKDLTTRALYDPVSGSKAVNTSDILCTVPKKMYDQIINNLKGNSFTFSAYMVYLLHQNGVRSTIVMGERGGDLTSAVLYLDKGNYYVASPVKDVRYFTDNNIDNVTRKLMYDTDGTLITDNSVINSSKIPFREYIKDFDHVSELDLYKDDNITLQDALDKMKIIG